MVWARRFDGLEGRRGYMESILEQKQGPKEIGHIFERSGCLTGRREEWVKEPFLHLPKELIEASPCPFCGLAFVPSWPFPQFSCCDFSF